MPYHAHMTIIPDPTDPVTFRLSSHLLDAWSDGQWREIRAGVDYPDGVSDESMCRRIRAAALNRQCSARTLTPQPGMIQFRLTPRQGANGGAS